MWQQWISGSLGIAAIIALFPYTPSGYGRTLLVMIGVAVALLGFWGGIVQARKPRQVLKI